MKKATTKTTTISIATLVVVFAVAIALILVGNYQRNHSLAKSVPITNSEIAVSSRLTNSATIDKLYVIDSADSLKQELKLTSLNGFDPATQVLVGVVLTSKPNSGYSIALDSTATLNNKVLINYRANQPAEGASYTRGTTYPKLFITLNRTDLPNFSPVNFVFANLTDGATQTVPKILGAQ